MAYSTALEEEEEAGWQCCMPPRGSFGVLSPSQGAAEGVRNRDNPPPQPRPVEAHLGAAMRSPLGAPGGRLNLGRAPMGGGCVLLAPHRAPSVRTGAPTEGRLAQGLSRGRSAPSAVSRSHWSGSQWETLVSYVLGPPAEERPRSYWNTPTSDLARASLFEAESYFLLGPVGTLPERGASETHYRTTHASSRGLAVGGIATSLRVPPVVRFGRLGRRGGEQGTRL